MASIPDKPYGLGVLESFDALQNGLKKIRSALVGTPNVPVARAEVNDLLRDFRTMRKEASDAQKQVKRIIKSLQKAWIEDEKPEKPKKPD